MRLESKDGQQYFSAIGINNVRHPMDRSKSMVFWTNRKKYNESFKESRMNAGEMLKKMVSNYDELGVGRRRRFFSPIELE